MTCSDISDTCYQLLFTHLTDIVFAFALAFMSRSHSVIELYLLETYFLEQIEEATMKNSK